MNPSRVLDRYTKVAPRYDKVVSFWAKAVFFPLDRYRREALKAMSIGSYVADTIITLGSIDIVLAEVDR